MKNKINLLRMLLLISFVTLISTSCKKDVPFDQTTELDNAKQWYLTTTTNSAASIKPSSGSAQAIKQDIAWDDAQIVRLSDGQNLVAVPISVFIAGQPAQGSYLLLIYKENARYRFHVLYDKEEHFFSIDKTANIEKLFKNALLENAKHSSSLASNSRKTMTVPGAQPICIDWYWTTYVYDEWGYPIEILSEIYLYTTCTEIGGGSGGGEAPSVDDEALRLKILAETEPIATASSVSSHFLEMSSNGNERKEAYKWSIAGNPLSGYVVWSHETGTHKKVGPNFNDWEWKELKHNNFSVANKPSYMTVTVTENGEAIPVLGTTTAGICVKCTIEASVLFRGAPFGYPSTDFERNSPVFYIHP